MTILTITGDPGVGKSTVVMNLVKALKERGVAVGGVVSREVRSKNVRIGFEFIDLVTNEKAPLASVTPAGSGPRVGKYVVSLDGCHFAAERLTNAMNNSNVVICDELGPMEFKSKEFVDCMEHLINLDKTIVVVVHKRLQHPIIDQFRKRADLFLNIDLQNRNNAHLLLLDRIA